MTTVCIPDDKVILPVYSFILANSSLSKIEQFLQYLHSAPHHLAIAELDHAHLTIAIIVHVPA